MKPAIIWRMKERRSLSRCSRLALASIPTAERAWDDDSHRIASQFELEVGWKLATDKLPAESCDKLEWRTGPIVVEFRLVLPQQDIEVLNVRMDSDDGPSLNNSSQPTPLGRG